jgi:hypothetical protein
MQFIFDSIDSKGSCRFSEFQIGELSQVGANLGSYHFQRSGVSPAARNDHIRESFGGFHERLMHWANLI